jgi:signal transduction histidine kinase
VVIDLIRRSLPATLYLVSGSVVALVVSIVLPTGIALGVGLVPVFLVGIPVLLLTMELWHLLARGERSRAALVLGEPIETPAPMERPRAGVLGRWQAMVRDRATWKELAWAVLLVPVAWVTTALAVAGWSLSLALLAVPVAAPLTREGTTLGDLAWPLWILAPIAGVAVFVGAATLATGLGEGVASLARSLLAPDEKRRLAERVSTLQTTRAGAVESADQTLRRIERDLHDGAQHRLAYVAMELGRARQKLQEDPEAAASLIDNAFTESKNAMTELRDLVRGIHPSVLSDRGLPAALSGLAGRCPVPVTLNVDVPERPPVAKETAAYFVVAEALTNVAKHAQATQVTVEVVSDDEGLRVTVTDDGRGGATTAPGGGLGGLAQRVAALDGTFEVHSPEGAGTTIKAVL